jgi:hypothetical protein
MTVLQTIILGLCWVTMYSGTSLYIWLAFTSDKEERTNYNSSLYLLRDGTGLRTAVCWLGNDTFTLVSDEVIATLLLSLCRNFFKLKFELCAKDTFSLPLLLWTWVSQDQGLLLWISSSISLAYLLGSQWLQFHMQKLSSLAWYQGSQFLCILIYLPSLLSMLKTIRGLNSV